jgi:hypothetical protein
MPGVSPLHQDPSAPRVSEPERALLEMLSEVGVHQPLDEARQLTESAYTLRSENLIALLRRCASVKTVRLCIALGRELDLPWAGKLPEDLPKGSTSRWVARSKDGLLVLKP